MADGNQQDDHKLSLESHVAVLSGAAKDLKSVVTDLSATVKTLSDRFTETQKTPWALILSFAGLLVLATAVLITIITVEMASATAPLSARLDVSTSDRAELHNQVKDTAIALANMQARVSSDEATALQHTAEIETQFGAIYSAVNQKNELDLTTRAILWQKVMGYPYPPFSYVIGPASTRRE